MDRKQQQLLEEIRVLLRVIIGLLALLVLIALIAGIVTISAAGQVQQQLGIGQ